MTVYLILCIVFGGFCSFVASQKNRNSVAWFLLGLFFNIIALLALIAIPKKEEDDMVQSEKNKERNRGYLILLGIFVATMILARFCSP